MKKTSPNIERITQDWKIERSINERTYNENPNRPPRHDSENPNRQRHDNGQRNPNHRC